jgi:hypothetical protein
MLNTLRPIHSKSPGSSKLSPGSNAGSYAGSNTGSNTGSSTIVDMLDNITLSTFSAIHNTPEEMRRAEKLEKERKKARRERRAKKAGKSGQKLSSSVGGSPAIDNSSRSHPGTPEIYRSKSQSPALRHLSAIESSTTIHQHHDVDVIQSKQKSFMERLNSNKSPVQTKSPPTIVPSAESPRVQSFRRKFPSISATNDKTPQHSNLESEFVMNDYDEDDGYTDGGATARLLFDDTDELKKEAKEETKEERKDKDEALPSQAAFIAKMWLINARAIIEQKRSSSRLGGDSIEGEEMYYGNDDLYELGGNGYGFDDNYVDYGDVQYDDAQHGSVEYNYEGGEGTGQVDKYGYDQRYDAHGYDAYAYSGELPWEGVDVARADAAADAGAKGDGGINAGWDDDVLADSDKQRLMEGSLESSVEAAPNIIVRSMAAFESTDQTELGFEVDTYIAVTSQDESGWWFGYIIPDDYQAEDMIDIYDVNKLDLEEIVTRSGWFPKTFVS